jgi:alcohol dehydrogenase
MKEFDFQPRTRVVFGEGAMSRLGEVARELNFRRTLLVTDAGLVAAGHVALATQLLERAEIEVVTFSDFDVNPDTAAVERGRVFAAAQRPDSIVALGGGSALDCAKGINFLLTNGGKMADYRGYGKAAWPMLPMIGIPTTTGTGSEAQSYTVISDAMTRAKMACGDPKAAFRAAVLDPWLAVTQPENVRAASGMDAIAHVVETYVSLRRNPLSEVYSRDAWRLLAGNFLSFFERPADLEAAGAMLLGAHLAGAAIENSMLGAAHACANPLTAKYDTSHGEALAILLPHVVRWNGPVAGQRYAELLALAGLAGSPLRSSASVQAPAASADVPEFDGARASRQAEMDADASALPGEDIPQAAELLAQRLEEWAAAAGLPRSLRDAGVGIADLPMLAGLAAEQWTGTFNPRPFDAAAARTIYEWAY